MTECYMCESTENLEVHHLLPVRKIGKTSSWDLIQRAESDRNKVVLCESCHQKIEDLYDDKFWNLVKHYVKKSKELDSETLHNKINF